MFISILLIIIVLRTGVEFIASPTTFIGLMCDEGWYIMWLFVNRLVFVYLYG